MNPSVPSIPVFGCSERNPLTASRNFPATSASVSARRTKSNAPARRIYSNPSSRLAESRPIRGSPLPRKGSLRITNRQVRLTRGITFLAYGEPSMATHKTRTLLVAPQTVEKIMEAPQFGCAWPDGHNDREAFHDGSARATDSTTSDHSPGFVCRNSRIAGYHGVSSRLIIQREQASYGNIRKVLFPSAPARCAIDVSTVTTRSSASIAAAVFGKSGARSIAANGGSVVRVRRAHHHTGGCRASRQEPGSGDEGIRGASIGFRTDRGGDTPTLSTRFRRGFRRSGGFSFATRRKDRVGPSDMAFCR